MNDYSKQFGGEKEAFGFYIKLRKIIKEQLDKRKKSDSKIDKASSILIEKLIWLPDLFHLSCRLLFDKKVPAKVKGALVGAIAYVIYPIDLIPDAIPIAGWIDDLVVMAMGLNHFFNTEDKKVFDAIHHYWQGEGDVFETIKHILEVANEAATFLPKQIMSIIKSMFPRGYPQKG